MKLVRLIDCLLFFLATLQLFSGQTLQWEDHQTYRSAKINPQPGKPGFSLMPPATSGINFSNLLSKARYTTNQIYLNGSGVAAGDFDGDGWCDLFFCGLGGRSVLYRNEGNWKFKDITSESGLNCADIDATGAAFADIDGDGKLDLIVNSIGKGVRIFHNEGNSRFALLPSPEPLNANRGGMSIALADIDGDGDLDLYVANYRTTTLRDMPFTRFRGKNRNGVLALETVNGRSVNEPDLAGRFTISPDGKIEEHGEPDALFLNDGKGHFTPVSFTDGRFLDENGRALDHPPFDWGLSVAFRDINSDGAPDIYVCNDFSSPDRIWINNGKGKFKALDTRAIRHMSLFSMGVDFGDLNRDGFDDFFTADMLAKDPIRRRFQIREMEGDRNQMRPQYSQNMLFINRGDGTYAEIAQFAGVHASDWSWSPVLLDVDLDGFEDLLISTGHERNTLDADSLRQIESAKASKKLTPPELLELNNIFPRLEVGNAAFRNRGDLTFEDATSAWGFDAAGVSHGIALADLDNDGDLDVIINNLNGVASVYRNNGSAPRIAVRLRGLPGNTAGIGAKVFVTGGPVRIQSQEMRTGGRYLSSDEPVLQFAAGGITNELDITVKWRSGKESVAKKIAANQICEISESFATSASTNPSTNQRPALFEDISSRLANTRQPNQSDEFASQPLLPRKLASAGPGLTWTDLDNDGADDLVTASGAGKLKAFLSGTKNTFRAVAAESVQFNDRTTALAFNAEILDSATLGINPEELGAMAVADATGAGDIILFAGNPGVPGRYPESSPSRLFARKGDKWVLAQEANLGLVRGAVFSDLDLDGRPELIVSSEWGPIRIFKVRDNPLEEITSRLGFSNLKGWWTGINVGDFDSDGRMDIVASNWGLNSAYQASSDHPQLLYYFAASGSSPQLLEAVFEPVLGKEIPLRDLKTLEANFPFIAERALSFHAFASMSVQDLFAKIKDAVRLEATILETCIFLNRGDHFEKRALPSQAQWSPAFGVCVGDVDGDGIEDIFLAQNFFGVRHDLPRCDAGVGLWLRGKGDGSFEPLSPSESGIWIGGEQRGAALCDFDHDGRIDLAVAQHGAETKLYHNIGAKRGLRVTLHGPPENPAAIGASIRLVYGNGKKGPAREIHAGSGYLSQDSAVAIMGMSGKPTGIEVRWPGGAITTTPRAENEFDLDVYRSGK